MIIESFQQYLDRTKIEEITKNCDCCKDSSSKLNEDFIFEDTIDEFKCGGLVAYTGDIKGSGTPTGKPNTFVNNSLKIGMRELCNFAKRYNIPTDSNSNFQAGLYDLVEKENNNII